MTTIFRTLTAAALFLSLGHGTAQAGTKLLSIGGVAPDAGGSWRASGSAERADDATEPGWILPQKIDRSQNLLNLLHKEGRLFPATGVAGDVPADKKLAYLARPGNGRIWSPNLDFALRESILMVSDGLLDDKTFNYFDRAAGNRGVTIYIDLGAPFPVNQIIFYPLKTGLHQELYMKGYELWASEGSKETTNADGQPVYHFLHGVPLNSTRVVNDSSFTPQHIRFIKIKSTADQPFEIDQIEVRGTGYVAEASYLSNVIDLADIANLGSLQWASDVEAGAALSIQTRVGRDPSVLRYFRINDIGEEEELSGLVPGDKELDDLYKLAIKDKPGRFDKLKQGLEMANDDDNRLAWLALAPSQQGRGGIDDDENWSLWSPPYSSSGEPVVVDGPRRYLQVRLFMTNERPLARAKVKQVSVGLSQPVPARQILGWIAPNRNVDLGRTVTFTYEMAPTIDPLRADTGFDIIDIATPTKASVLGVKLAGRSLERGTDYSTVEESKRLRIELVGAGNRVKTSNDRLEVVFDCAVLAYGTVFKGAVSASWFAGDVPQAVEEERLGDLTVKASESSLGLVIGEFAVSPAVFTPNGDGVNDMARISFKVFQVVGSAPIALAIYESRGRLVRRSFPGMPTDVENGEFTVFWDGLDEDGNVVKIGLYNLRLELQGDKHRFARVADVGVVY